MNLAVFGKLNEFKNASSVILNERGGFEVADTDVYIKYNGEAEPIFSTEVGIANIALFCKAVRLMGTEATVQHIKEETQDINVLRMSAGQKELEYGLADIEVVRKNSYVQKDDVHILDRLAANVSRITMKISLADRKEIKDALALIESEEAYLEQTDKGFFFVAGKGSKISCKIKLGEGNPEIGKIFLKFKKDHFVTLLNAVADDVDFIFHVAKGKPGLVQVFDGATIYVVSGLRK